MAGIITLALFGLAALIGIQSAKDLGREIRSEAKPREPRNADQFVKVMLTRANAKSPVWTERDLRKWMTFAGLRFGAKGYGWTREDAAALADEFLNEMAGCE